MRWNGGVGLHLSFTFKNNDNLSVVTIITCLEIIVLGYWWRVVLRVVDNAW